MVAERNQTPIGAVCPSPPLAGEREGPAPKAWEGEVVLGNSGATAPPPSLYPLPPQAGGEEGRIIWASIPPQLTLEHVPHCRANGGG